MWFPSTNFQSSKKTKKNCNKYLYFLQSCKWKCQMNLKAFALMWWYWKVQNNIWWENSCGDIYATYLQCTMCIIKQNALLVFWFEAGGGALNTWCLEDMWMASTLGHRLLLICLSPTCSLLFSWCKM